MCRFLFLICLASAIGCALPPSRTTESFVSERERLAVELYREGLTQLDSGRFFDAEAALRKAQYLFPQARNIRESLAITLIRVGDVKEGVRLAEALERDSPAPMEWRTQVAYALGLSGDTERALRTFQVLHESALTRRDFDLALRTSRNLSALSFRLGRETEALCFAEEAHTLSGGVQEDVIRVSRLLNATNQTENSSALTARYLDEPWSIRSGDFLYQRALALLAEGSSEEAARYARLASEAASPALRTEAAFLLGLFESTVEGESATPQSLRLPPRAALFWPAATLDTVTMNQEPTTTSDES